MTFVTNDDFNSDPNKRTAQKLASGIRSLYRASSDLSEHDIKQKIQQLIDEFAQRAPNQQLNSVAVFQELKHCFSIPDSRPAIAEEPPQADIPSTLTSATTTSAAAEPSPETNSEHAPSEPKSRQDRSIVHGLGYDAKLASLLLHPNELALTPALQRKAMLTRILRARKIAEQNGLSLLDLLDNMDALLKAKNESFYLAVNQSFFTIIHHLNPRRARKLGLPLSSDLGQPRWLDFKRLKRLIEYIQCGRMAKDTALDYARRLKQKLR